MSLYFGLAVPYRLYFVRRKLSRKSVNFFIFDPVNMNQPNGILYPEFWTLVEANLSIESTAIKDIKDVLTFLGYKTPQSISKLVQKREIRLLELELINLKKMNSDWLQKYPFLENINFGSGFLSTLSNIASNIKQNFAAIDLSLCAAKVLDDIKGVCPSIVSTNIDVKSVGGVIKCVVTCPFCNKNSALSPYWTQTGHAFRIFNFQRHLREHNEAGRQQQEPHQSQHIQQTQQSQIAQVQAQCHESLDTIQNAELQRSQLKKVCISQLNRMKRVYNAMKIRNVVASKKIQLLKSEIALLKKSQSVCMEKMTKNDQYMNVTLNGMSPYLQNDIHDKQQEEIDALSKLNF